MQSLQVELQEKITELHQLVSNLRQSGAEKASAEREYRVGLRKMILALKAEGYPATLISDLARGDEHIAELKLLRDCAEEIHRANLEAINAKKLEIRVISEQQKQDWFSGNQGIGGYE